MRGWVVAFLALLVVAVPVPLTDEEVRRVRVDVPRLLEAAGEAAGALPRLHGLLVSWRGGLLLERYYNGTTATALANVKSASKSFISALVGIAIDRGLIRSVAEPIRTYLPELAESADDARKTQITIEDLLTMRSGLESTSSGNYGAWVLSRNWVRYALSRRLVSEPGTTMIYSTGNTHLLSAILARASGQSTRRFAQETLAGPLGFTLAEWPRDPQGVYFGGNDMLLTPRQMLAFGELYLRKGRFGGRRILPAEWVEASFVPRGRSRWSGRRYGYGWWIREMSGRRVFYAWGWGGQFIFVVPELEMVIVATSSTDLEGERRGHRRELAELIETLIIAPLSPGAEERIAGNGAG